MIQTIPKHKQRQGYHTIANAFNNTNANNVSNITNNTALLHSITNNSNITNKSTTSYFSTHQSTTDITTNHRTITRYVHTHPQPVSTQHNNNTRFIPRRFNNNVDALYASYTTAVQLAQSMIQSTQQRTNTFITTAQRLIHKFVK